LDELLASDDNHADSYTEGDNASKLASGDFQFGSNIVVLQPSSLSGEGAFTGEHYEHEAHDKINNEQNVGEDLVSEPTETEAQSRVSYYTNPVVPKSNSVEIIASADPEMQFGSNQNTMNITEADGESDGNSPSKKSGSSDSHSDNYESVGVGRVTYLGDITDSADAEVEAEINDSYRDECTDPVEQGSNQGSSEGSSTQQQSFQRTFWSGTKPLLSNVQRDTLYSSGFLGVTGIGLMGIERNDSVNYRPGKVQAKYEVLACPAQSFTLRFSIMGELFGEN